MREASRFGAAFAAMQDRRALDARLRVLRLVLALAVALLAGHVLGDLGARVAADLHRAAGASCGAC